MPPDVIQIAKPEISARHSHGNKGILRRIFQDASDPFHDFLDLGIRQFNRSLETRAAMLRATAVDRGDPGFRLDQSPVFLFQLGRDIRDSGASLETPLKLRDRGTGHLHLPGRDKNRIRGNARRPGFRRVAGFIGRLDLGSRVPGLRRFGTSDWRHARGDCPEDVTDVILVTFLVGAGDLGRNKRVGVILGREIIVERFGVKSPGDHGHAVRAGFLEAFFDTPDHRAVALFNAGVEF